MKPGNEKVELILRRVGKFTRNESWRINLQTHTYVLIIAKLGLGWSTWFSKRWGGGGEVVVGLSFKRRGGGGGARR